MSEGVTGRPRQAGQRCSRVHTRPGAPARRCWPAARLTYHDVQALVRGPLRHDILNAGLVDVHGPPVLDHSACDVEVLGAVHLEVAVEEVVASFICES